MRDVASVIQSSFLARREASMPSSEYEGREWGVNYRGGDSNPRPADYETAALTN